MAVTSPSSTPKTDTKDEEKPENGESRRGRSPERRGSKGEKRASPSRSSSKDSMYLPSNDTNSTDPESVRCRVFVGNLNTDKIGQEELVKHFSQFGEIAGCSLHANFGFVQYANRADADVAVAKSHGTFLFGKRVDVNIASERRKPQSRDKRKGYEGMPHSRRRSRSRSGERFRSRSPMSRYDDLYRKDDPFGRGERQYSRDIYDDKRDDYYDSLEPLGRPRDPASKDAYAPASSKTACCEVIAMSGDLKNYAESIQSRFNAMGINTNIMFPPQDVSVLRIVDSVSRNGSLYAVVITSQNYYHRSCTLNVLHGAPQGIVISGFPFHSFSSGTYGCLLFIIASEL